MTASRGAVTDGCVRYAEVRCLRKNIDEKVKISKRIFTKTQPLIEFLGLSDWDIEVAYSDDESDCKAECECNSPQNKQARIVFYQKNPSEAVIMHELMHIKLGMLTKYYDEAMEVQANLINNLIEMQEEYFIDSMTERLLRRKRG